MLELLVLGVIIAAGARLCFPRLYQGGHVLGLLSRGSGGTKAWHHGLALFFSMAMARTKSALPYAQGLQK